MSSTNRFQMHINSLRQKSNSKWKEFSNIYSKFLIRFSWSILAVSSFLTIGLTIYFLLFMQIRSFDQNDFLLSNSQARKNAFHLKEIFGNDMELRIHQQLNLYPALDIIIKRKSNTNQTNMLMEEIVDEVRLLDKQIQSIRINNSDNSIEYNYSSLCLKMNHACMIDGNYLLTDQFRRDISNLSPPKNGYYIDDSSANGIPGFMFGKDYLLINATSIDSDYVDLEEKDNDSREIIEKPLEKIISYVSLFRLRYALNITTIEMKQLANQWERQILHYLNNEYQSILIDIFPSTSTAITDTIAKKSHEEGLYMILMIGIFFIFYYFFLIIQGNFHTSVGYLPFCGIISIGLSTGATFGILTLFRIQIIEPMALLSFGVIIIDCIRISIVCGEYHRVIKEHMISISDMSSEIDIEKILPSIIESTHPYFLNSTIILSIVYLLFGLISPMFSTKLFSLTLIFYIILNYLVHSTFFSSCLIITLKRLSSRRHCLFCYHLPNDYYINMKKNFFQFKFFSSLLKNNKNFLWQKKIFSIILCLLFLIIASLSIWFVILIDTCLFNDKFLPQDAYSLRKHMKSQMNDFNIGPVIMFTIPEIIDYENKQIQFKINSLINQCQNKIRTNNFKFLWLDNENLDGILYGKNDFQMRISPFSRNDLILSQGLHSILINASRFYCQLNSIQGDYQDIQTMNNMYIYSKQSQIPSIFPYSLIFPTYESLKQIRLEIYFLILILIIILFIILLIFYISILKSLIISFHYLILLTSTFTCLYLFHNLTFNFVNILWFYILPIIYIDIFVHQSNSKWIYNRVILSLIISLIIFSFFSIQSYVFQIIHYSFLYQSIICLILINFILPLWFDLFQKKENKPKQDIEKNIEGNQVLTNGLEI